VILATNALLHRRNRWAGFTILELLVVLSIIGLLVGMVAPSALRQLGSAKNKVAAQSISRLVEVLDIYKLDVGAYPTTEQGLNALITKPEGISGWEGPYLKPAKLPLDPWNRPFQYVSPSSRADHGFDLFSYGEKGQPGGTGESATIKNE
jgi:general secretion pathway protein G